jgi:hypothetical protein
MQSLLLLMPQHCNSDSDALPTEPEGLPPGGLEPPPGQTCRPALELPEQPLVWRVLQNRGSAGIRAEWRCVPGPANHRLT